MAKEKKITAKPPVKKQDDSITHLEFEETVIPAASTDEVPFDESVIVTEREQSESVIVDTLSDTSDTELDKVLEHEITKFNLADAWIEEKKAKCLAMKINGQEDKEGYEAIKEELRIIKEKRINVGKTKDKINEGALKWQRTVNAEAKRLVTALEPIEQYLFNQKSEYEAEKERIKQEKKNAEQRLFTERSQKLFAYGYTLEGEFFVHEGLDDRIHDMLLKEMDESWFQEIVQKNEVFKAEQAAIELAEQQKRAEEERLLQIQKQEQEAEALRQEEQRKALEAQQKAQEEERLAMLQERYDVRIGQLEILGLVKVPESASVCFGVHPNLKYVISFSDVQNFTKEQWQEALVKITHDVNELKKKEQEEKQKASELEKVVLLRTATLQGLGLIFNGSNFTADKINVPLSQVKSASDTDFESLVERVKSTIAEVEKEKEEKRKAQEEEAKRAEQLKQQQAQEAELKKQQEEEQRQMEARALMSDKELVTEYFDKVSAVEVPVLKSAKYKKMVKEFTDFITNFRHGI